MSLENKKSSLSTPSYSGNKSGKNLSKFGTIFKSPNPISDIDRTAVPVDGGSKSRINRTIPVEQLPQEAPKEPIKQEEIVEPKTEVVPEEEAPKKAPIVSNRNFLSGTKSEIKF